MEFSRWINPSLPQTLLYATYLLYFHAVMAVLFGSIGFFATFDLAPPIGLFLMLGSIAAALGIANDYKWGWILGLVVSAVPMLAVLSAILSSLGVVSFDFGRTPRFGLSLILNAMFPAAQLALVAHPMSRDHQKIWFR